MQCENLNFFEIWLERFEGEFADQFSIDEIEEQVGLALAVVSGALSAVPALAGLLEGIVDGLATAVAAAVEEFNRSPAEASGASDLLARIFGNSLRGQDPLVFDLDGGGAQLTALAANDNGQGMMGGCAA